MEIPDVEGIDKLYQAVSEALEIEKCSICLERLENTVLLWPCTHWFCNKCILTLHQSAKGEKVKCPLCKSATTRRKVLAFQDKQTQYEDHLQTLIGALSLDLKFDVTSYNNVSKHDNPAISKIMETSKAAVELSPLKKTRTKASVRVVEVKKKSDMQPNYKRPIRRSVKLQPKNNISGTAKSTTRPIESPKQVPSILPETPDGSPKKKKVKEWLDSNKFSQADQDNVCVETVIADIHNAEKDESLCFSETALQSVSQVDYRSIQTPNRHIPTKKSIDTPSDINAIKVYNKPSENLFSAKSNRYKDVKAISIPAVEKFDEIFPENRKLQTVTTTYGSKNPYVSTCKKGQRFAVQVDLFKSIDENKGEINKSSPQEVLDDTEETLEDFSSGSGEEWTTEKGPRKYNLISKKIIPLKNNIKQTAQRKTKYPIDKYVKAMPIRSSLRNMNKQDFKSQKIKHNDLSNLNNCKEDANKTQVKSVGVEELDNPKEDVVKEIIDDWNETKESNNIFIVNNQALAKHDEKNATLSQEYENISETKYKTNVSELKSETKSANIVVNTPCKEVNTRSPGWSRLKSTKKEFHLSEKKKLNLKTFHKSKSNSSLTNIGISPLLNQSKSSVDSLSKNEAVNHISMDKRIASSLKNEVNDQSSKEIDVDVHCEIKTKKTPELNKNLNTSRTSSASGSPFRGFPTPDEKECSRTMVLNLNRTKETHFKASNSIAFSYPQRKSDISNTVPNKELEVNLQDSLLKEKSMEVDTSLEGPQLPYQCENNHDKNVITKLKMAKESRVTVENLNSLETSSVTNIFQKEPKECPVLIKKRDRDSGIHNESGISSPIRKRVCRDAEVQTSPGRMQSVIRDMLKDMCGVELEEMIKQSNKADLPTNDVRSPHHSFIRLSQGSDKENVDISSKNESIFQKCFDDSDIVYGTEDSIALAQVNPLAGVFHNNNKHKTQEALNINVFKGNKALDYNDVDPDAPTQLYKTPVVLKRPLQTSTKEYTVVSNPTTSELKKTEYLFDKSDVIFPDETPKGTTPWNYSGVNQLEENTGTLNKFVVENDVPPPSLSLKEKANKSRRQLDFVEENSNDIFEFEKPSSGRLREDIVHNESNKCLDSDKIEALHDQIGELDDMFMESNGLSIEAGNSPSKEKESCISDKTTLMVKHHEVSLVNKIGNEILHDTPGIVGPSEVQCYDNRVNSYLPNNHSNMDDSNKNTEVDKPVICSLATNEVLKDLSDVHQDSAFMLKQSLIEQKESVTNCVNAKEDDEVSNPLSDISFVEGTPDVSQSEERHEKVINSEYKIGEIDGQPEKVDTSGEVHEEREGAKPAISSHDPFDKDTSQSMDKKLQLENHKIIKNDESVSNQMIENTETEHDSLCFASSLLNPQQNQVLACVLGGMGLTYSKTVGPHISHLIVGTKNGCFQNTYKVLLAMALHKPIIRFDWVEEVIKTGGTVPLDPFVALDPSGECGVLRARADKNRELLQDFAILIYNVNDRIVLKEQIEELVRLCGGTVVKELHNFYDIPRDKFRIIVLSEPPDSLTQGDWRQKYSAADVMIDWIYNTIGRYRVMPLVPFMVTDAADAVPFLQHEGYPKEFIFDLFSQE